MGNKLYDGLKWVALVFLPALATTYIALGAVWNLPSVEQVVGTITAIDTFLGLLLKQSARKYGSDFVIGEAIVRREPDGTPDKLSFIVDSSVSPAVMQDRKIAMFTVRREQQSE